MKSSLLKLALAAVVLCAPVAVHAQTDTTNPIATAPVKNPDKTAKKAKTKTDKIQYTGTVKSIDATSVVVTTKKGDLTLAINDKTEIKNDKKKAAATDLTTGEKVTGSYLKNADGTMTACSLRGHTK